MPTEGNVMEDLQVSMRPEENIAFNNQQEGSSDSFISINTNSESKAALYKAIEHMENSERKLAQQEYDKLLESDYPNQLFANVHESQQDSKFSKFSSETDSDKADLEKLTWLQLKLTKDIPSVKPHALVTYLAFPPNLVLEVLKAYANDALSNANNMKLTSAKRQKALGPRCKIAFVSSDIKDHSLSHLISGLFSCFNRNDFVIDVFALNSTDNSEVRSIIENDADHFYDVSALQFENQCEKLKEGEYDIIVNLNGYTVGSCNELFALKLAPVQAMWLGFPGTSGSDYIDYFVSDKVSTPKENEQYFSETVICLPFSHFVGNHARLYPHLEKKVCVQVSQQNQDFVDNNAVINVVSQKPLQNHEIKKVRVSVSPENERQEVEYETVDQSFLLRLIIGNSTQNVLVKVFWYFCCRFCLLIPFLRQFAWKTVFSRFAQICNSQQDFKVTSRCMYGLPYGRIVFCNFCQPWKNDESTLTMWRKILSGVPDSVLWLLVWKKEAKKNILHFFTQSGIDKNRIIFTPPSKKEEYIRFSQLADVFLDTPLCNGHTTCMDALWAGLPVVTLPGERLAQRIAASQVTTIGCEELIAKNEEDYVRIAIELGTERKNLQSIRARIYNNRKNCSLFNNEVFCKGLEQVFLLMVKEKMTGESSGRSYEQLKDYFETLVACQGNRVEAVVKNIEIDTSSFRSLSKDKDVDKIIVEVSLAVLVQKTSKGTYLIDPDTLSNVMDDKFEGDLEIANKIETCLGGLQKDIDMKKDSYRCNIIGAFHANGHWQLLFVSLDEKRSSFTVIDPVTSTSKVQTDLKYKWSRFMAYLQKEKPYWSWTKNTFVFQQRPYKVTESLVSCGPVCLAYAEIILSQQTPSVLEINLSGIPTDIASVNGMREKIGCNILKEAELDHICRRCSKIDHESKVLCRNCSQHQ